MKNDLFENKILCKNCEKVMKPALISKNGFNLRALKCEKCGEVVVHPVDKQEYEEFMRLKNKDFEVKMRMVGNSYAVSIPREIVDFMKEQENIMNNMVKLCFEEAGRISLMFGDENSNNPPQNSNSRVIKSKEVSIVRNNKPILHSKQFYDSANPQRNRNIILKAKNKQFEKEDKIEEEEL